jgi:methyl-accepting chemotaxis protein
VTESLSNVTTRIASSSENVLAVADVQKTAIERSAATMGEMLDSTAAVASGAESLSLSAVDTSSAISQMKQAIERVSESSNVFEASTNEAASSIEEMFANIKEISQALESLSSSSEGIASSVSEVNTTVKEIEEHATRSVGLSEQVVVDASDKGEAAAHAATEGMEDIRRSVGVLSEVINVLGKRSVDIGTILSVIEEVTERTTLLSLNAAILAAQAGEHGKSFSVVADEIKSLAERTAHSTREISQLINSVQTETRSSVKMAGEGLLAVEKGLTLVGEVHEALKGITQSSLASTEMSKAIQRSTSEESQAIRQINDAVVEMTKQVEKISNALQEQNRGGKFVIEQTETMKEMSHHVKTALGEQRDGSRQIASAVEDVAHQAESIAQATGMQKQKSYEMVQAMDEIRNTTGNLTLSSKEMFAAIESLKGDAGNLLAALQKFRV